MSSKEYAQLNATSGYYKAVLTGTDNKTLRYWKGGTSAQRVDGSAETKELWMVGGDSSDTLVGGSKGDTIQTRSIEGAYAIDGAGDDSIVLGSTDGSVNEGQADALRQFVEISTSSGKDDVRNFKAGFADTNDVLVLSDGAIEDAKFTVDAGLVVKSGSGQASIAGAAANATDNVVLMMKAGSADAAKVAVVNAANANGYKPTAADSLAGYYVSTSKTGHVDLSDISDNVVVELSNLGNYEDNATFKGIDSVTGGMGNTTLVGDGNVKNYIAAGTSKTTIWSGLGAANDTLRGTNGDVTSFYFGKNNGEDLIVASDSDDKVVFYDFANTDLTAIDTTGSQLKFTFNDGSSLQIQSYTTESVQTFEFNNSSWTYDRESRTFTQTK